MKRRQTTNSKCKVFLLVMCQLRLKNSPKVGLGENIKLSLSHREREREESGKEMKILQCSSSLSGDNCGHVHSHLTPRSFISPLETQRVPPLVKFMFGALRQYAP